VPAVAEWQTLLGCWTGKTFAQIVSGPVILVRFEFAGPRTAGPHRILFRIVVERFLLPRRLFPDTGFSRRQCRSEAG